MAGFEGGMAALNCALARHTARNGWFSPPIIRRILPGVNTDTGKGMKEIRNYIDTIRQFAARDQSKEKILGGTAADLLKLLDLPQPLSEHGSARLMLDHCDGMKKFQHSIMDYAGPSRCVQRVCKLASTYPGLLPRLDSTFSQPFSSSTTLSLVPLAIFATTGIVKSRSAPYLGIS